MCFKFLVVYDFPDGLFLFYLFTFHAFAFYELSVLLYDIMLFFFVYTHAFHV